MWVQFVVVMVTPIGLNNIGGNFFWIWGIINALFIPLTWFFGVETSGRTLEQVDRMFYEEPRIMMGLNPNHRKVSACMNDRRCKNYRLTRLIQVIKYSREDEENRFKKFADIHERKLSVADIDKEEMVRKLSDA